MSYTMILDKKCTNCKHKSEKASHPKCIKCRVESTTENQFPEWEKL